MLKSLSLAILIAITMPAGLPAQSVAYIPSQTYTCSFVCVCNAYPFGDFFNPQGGASVLLHIPSSFLPPSPFQVTQVYFLPCDGSFPSTIVMPDARIIIGHVPASGPGALSPNIFSNFLDQTVLYDSTANGPLVVTATAAGTWFPVLSGDCTPFVWNGINDIGLYVTRGTTAVIGPGSWNGRCRRAPDFSPSAPAWPYRYGANGFNATVATDLFAGGSFTGLGLNTSGCTPPFGLSVVPLGGGAASVAAFGIPAGTVEGWTFISATPTNPVGSGSVFGAIPDATTFFILTAFPVASPGNPFHWTWPVGGPLFPAAAFSVPPAILPFGQTWDFVGFALDPALNLLAFTPVEQVTWN